MLLITLLCRPLALSFISSVSHVPLLVLLPISKIQVILLTCCHDFPTILYSYGFIYFKISFQEFQVLGGIWENHMCSNFKLILNSRPLPCWNPTFIPSHRLFNDQVWAPLSVFLLYLIILTKLSFLSWNLFFFGSYDQRRNFPQTSIYYFRLTHAFLSQYTLNSLTEQEQESWANFLSPCSYSILFL